MAQQTFKVSRVPEGSIVLFWGSLFTLLCFFVGLYFVGEALESIPWVGEEGVVIFAKYVVPSWLLIRLNSQG